MTVLIENRFELYGEEYQKIKLIIVCESDRKTFKDNKKQTMEQK
jgi:hypothetical protein